MTEQSRRDMLSYKMEHNLQICQIMAIDCPYLKDSSLGCISLCYKGASGFRREQEEKGNEGVRKYHLWEYLNIN